jgi:hypothetical protein
VYQSDDPGLKNAFNAEITAFLDEIAKSEADVQYIEDYAWLNDTLIFWERYLLSAYAEVRHYSIPIIDRSLAINYGAKQSLTDVGALDQKVQKLLERVSHELSVAGTNGVLVKGIPHNIQSSFVHFLDQYKKLGYQHVQVVPGEWNSYADALPVLKQVNTFVQNIKQRGERMPLVLLSDNAFDDLQFTARRTNFGSYFQRMDVTGILHDIKRYLALEFIYQKIPVLYFIKNIDFPFFERSFQIPYWKTIHVEDVLPPSSMLDIDENYLLDKLKHIRRGNDIFLFVRKKIGDATGYQERGVSVYIHEQELEQRFGSEHKDVLHLFADLGLIKRAGSGEYKVEVVKPFMTQVAYTILQ